MNTTTDSGSTGTSTDIPNGAGAAAVLAAGLAAFLLAVLSITADHLPRFKQAMIFYRPTGPLSGVTTSAIVLWLATWAALHLRWRHRTVAFRPIAITAVALLIAGALLTFPPIGDLF